MLDPKFLDPTFYLSFFNEFGWSLLVVIPLFFALFFHKALNTVFVEVYRNYVKNKNKDNGKE